MIKPVVAVTNGTRHKIAFDKSLLSKYNNIFKNLRLGYRSSGGRNNTGRITVRHKGSGCKKSIYLINDNGTYFAIVIKVMYDPKRNSFVSFCFDFLNKTFFKTIATSGCFVGNIIISTKKKNKELKAGSRATFYRLPLGSVVHSVNLNKKTTFAKSAGTYCQIIDKRLKKTLLRMPSGKLFLIKNHELATLGIVSNKGRSRLQMGKAGFARLKGIRPSVRGIAMNPVDHPHGGRSNKGMPPVTPWGICTRGKKTVINKKIITIKKSKKNK
jgi:large subunit ribosomal protein L2